MSANVEEAIQRKVHKLADEKQKEVLEFVEGLDENAHRAEVSRFSISAGATERRNLLTCASTAPTPSKPRI